MALSQVSYVANGSTNQFVVSFPYLSRTHVSVTVNDAAESFTWISGTTIQTASSAASLAGKVVKIKRRTSYSARLVDFPSVGTLQEEDLDTDSLQAFYMAQEAIDEAADIRSVVDSLSLGGVLPIASSIIFAPSGNLSGVTVQAALTELDNEKASLSGATFTGFIRVTGSDPDFNSGGASSFMDLSGTTARIGYRHGGGGAGSVGIYSGNSVITAWATTDNRLIVGGAQATGPTWDERFSVQTSSNSHVLIGAYTNSTSYTGDILRVQAETAPGAAWKFASFRAVGGSEQASIRSDGAYWHGDAKAFSRNSVLRLGPFAPVSSNFISAAHGFGRIPRWVKLVLVCKSSDRGYGPSQELELAPNGEYAGQGAWATSKDGTDVRLSINGTIAIPNANGSTAGPINNANWDVFFDVWD